MDRVIFCLSELDSERPTIFWKEENNDEIQHLGPYMSANDLAEVIMRYVDKGYNIVWDRSGKYFEPETISDTKRFSSFIGRRLF